MKNKLILLLAFIAVVISIFIYSLIKPNSLLLTIQLLVSIIGPPLAYFVVKKEEKLKGNDALIIFTCLLKDSVADVLNTFNETDDGKFYPKSIHISTIKEIIDNDVVRKNPNYHNKLFNLSEIFGEIEDHNRQVEVFIEEYRKTRVTNGSISISISELYPTETRTMGKNIKLKQKEVLRLLNDFQVL